MQVFGLLPNSGERARVTEDCIVYSTFHITYNTRGLAVEPHRRCMKLVARIANTYTSQTFKDPVLH